MKKSLPQKGKKSKAVATKEITKEANSGITLAQMTKFLKAENDAQVAVEARDWLHAILAYNSMLATKVGEIDSVNKLIEMLEKFYREESPHFSQEDLVIFSQPIEKLIALYSYHLKSKKFDLVRAQFLHDLITSRIPDAPTIAHSEVGPKVKEIVDALYPDSMTREEVKVELARILLPLVREKYEEASKRNSKRKRKGTTGSKGTREGDNLPESPKTNSDDNEKKKKGNNEDNETT